MQTVDGHWYLKKMIDLRYACCIYFHNEFQFIQFYWEYGFVQKMLHSVT